MTAKTMSPAIILLIIISVVVIFLYVKKENRLQSESASWIPTKAVVTSSHVRRDRDKNSGAPKTLYWFEIQYNYNIDNKTYSGDRFSFHGNPFFSNKTDAEKLMTAYPTGKRINIYYQPGNPQESVINR